MASQKSTTATNDKGQRQRVPFGGPRRRQHIPDELLDKNYKYRYINDVEDRIQRALAAGYEFVTKKEISSVGDPDLGNQAQGVDSRVSKQYRDHKSYLMKIKKEYWLEDQAAKQREADEADEAIFHSNEKVQNSYGLDVNYKR